MTAKMKIEELLDFWEKPAVDLDLQLPELWRQWSQEQGSSVCAILPEQDPPWTPPLAWQAWRYQMEQQWSSPNRHVARWALGLIAPLLVVVARGAFDVQLHKLQNSGDGFHHG